MHPKQFIPGPVEVDPELLQAQTIPMVGHRSPEYIALHKGIVEKFKKYMKLENHDVFLFSSSATGVMEAAIRNCVRTKVLHTVCGAFSKRWRDISEGCGTSHGSLEVEWGDAVTGDLLEQALKGDTYDAVTITHNETSTGVLHNLDELIPVIKKDPNRLVFVDAVSSFGGTVIYPEEPGIDVLIFGTQKCLGLPPGLGFGVVSPRALEVSSKAVGKGYYFDFQVMKKYSDKFQTPSTPAISLLNALSLQLDRLLAEGMEARAERHSTMADMTHEWCEKEGFELAAVPEHASTTMTAVANTPGIDIDEFRARLTEKGFVVANAYGKLKGTGFRIGHMADWQPSDVEELLNVMSQTLEEMNA